MKVENYDDFFNINIDAMVKNTKNVNKAFKYAKTILNQQYVFIFFSDNLQNGIISQKLTRITKDRRREIEKVSTISIRARRKLRW